MPYFLTFRIQLYISGSAKQFETSTVFLTEVKNLLNEFHLQRSESLVWSAGLRPLKIQSDH